MTREAFHASIAAASKTMMKFAFSFERDKPAAEDLMARSVIKALDSFEERGFTPDPKVVGNPLQAWFYRVIRNEFISSLRTIERKPGRTIYLEDAVELPEHRAPDAMSKLRAFEMLTAFRDLTQRQKWALLLVIVDGMTIAEAAAHMGVEEGTVKSLMNRGRNAMCKMLDQEPPVYRHSNKAGYQGRPRGPRRG